MRIRRPLSSLYQTCLVRRPPLRRAPLRRPPLPPSPTVSGFSRGEEEEEGEICLAAQNMFEVTPLDPNYLVIKLDPRTILKAAGTGYPDTLKYVKEQTERGEEISLIVPRNNLHVY